jgi:diguanylate cyclase (GGDEF)-like protein
MSKHAQHSSLELVDASKYFSLMKTLAPSVVAMAICDSEGIPVWANTDTQGNEFKANLALGHTHIEVLEREKGFVQCQPVADGKTLYEAPLITRSGNGIGVLMMLFDGAAPDLTALSSASLKDAISAIAVCLCDDYALNTELNAMAEELAARYEELNLLYVTDKEVDEFSQIENTLRELVKSCTEIFDVLAAALILPEKGITLLKSDFNRPLPHIHSVLELLKNDFYEALKSNRKSIVINDSTVYSEFKEYPEFPYKLIVSPLLQRRDSVSGFIVVFRRIKMQDFSNSDRSLLEVLANKASKVIQYNYDVLTGLMKGNGFEHKLREAVMTAREKDSNYCVLNVNLDRMKIINDMVSHQLGDEIIKQIGQLMVKQLRDTDSVARLGGDVFGVLLDKCPLDQGQQIAEKLKLQINDLEFVEWSQIYHVTATIGIALLTANTESVESVLSAAETATRVAKEHGGNQVRVYDLGDDHITRRKDEMYWVNEVLAALREDGFQLYFQPIEPLGEATGIAHGEILLRLLGKDGQTVSPGLFMPAIENYHMMPAVDRWVVEHSLKTLAEMGLSAADAVWSINLSGQSLGAHDFTDFIIDQLYRSGILPRSICFEITETSAIGNMDEARRFISAVKKLGCRFALDDFGVGLSSFAYLKNLPLDYLKIDGSFIKEITQDPVSSAMVSAINKIGHLMGLETIGEYVENDEIKCHLQKLGIDYGQGYGIAKPQPLEPYLRELIQRQGVRVA